MTFYGEGGHVVTLKANEGAMKKRKDFDVSGDVVITSSEGFRVSTYSLHYDNERRQITTTDPVILEGKGVRVKGVGAVVDVDSKMVTILKDVETFIEG